MALLLLTPTVFGVELSSFRALPPKRAVREQGPAGGTPEYEALSSRAGRTKNPDLLGCAPALLQQPPGGLAWMSISTFPLPKRGDKRPQPRLLAP